MPPAIHPYAHGLRRHPPQSRSPWFYVAVIGGSFAAICLVFWASWSGASMRSAAGATPVLAWETTRSLSSISMASSFRRRRSTAQLRKFGDDSSVKAIIPAHQLARRRSCGIAGDLPRGSPRPEGETQEDRRLRRKRRGLRRLLHRQRLRQDLRQRSLCRRLDRRHHGVDELRRPAEVGEAQKHHHHCRRAQGSPATPAAT